MENTCNRCDQSISSKYSSFSDAFCAYFCKGFTSKNHSKECEELPFFVSYLLKDDCLACKNDVCDKDCCHNLPSGDVDYKKLAYYKYWFDIASEEEMPRRQPGHNRRRNRDTSKINSWRSSSTLEEHDSGNSQRQNKVRNIFEEHDSGNSQRQNKVRNKFEEYDSGNSQRQNKVRNIFEENLTNKNKTKFTPNTFEEFMNDYQEEYSYGGHNPGADKKEVIKVAFETGNEQFTRDEAARDIYVALSRETVRCYRVDSDGNKTGFLFGHGFGNHIVTPAHLYPRTKINCTFCFRTKSGKEIEMRMINFNRMRDVAVWKFDETQGFTFPNRYFNNLISEKDYIQIAKKTSTVLQHLPQKDILQVVSSSVVTHHSIYLNGTGIQDYEKLFVIKAAMTTAPLTSAGDCGGLIVLYDTNYTRKVIGFHVVGTGECAYAAITTKELIESLMIPRAHEEDGELFVVDQPYSKYPIVDLLDQVKTEMVGCVSKNMPIGDFHYVGELDYLAKPAAKTLIKKHPFYGVFEEKLRPANLTVDEVEDKSKLLTDANGEPNLIISRTSKYGKIFKNKVDPEILNSMQTQLIEYYKDNFKGVDLSASTEDEILNGKEHDAHSHPLDMRTSPGVPWGGNGQGMGRKKDFYCTMVETEDSLGKPVLKRVLDRSKLEVKKFTDCVEKTDSLAKKGVRTLSIIKDCLKDECRPLDKVWKPRVFKAFPMDKVYLLRKYTLKFKTEWTRLRERMFHAVGINVMSPEWTKLYHLLKEKSNYGGDADFGTFDGNLRAEFMQVAVEVIVATIMAGITEEHLKEEGCTREEYETALRVLLDENIKTISVSGKTVYMDSHGNPSGSPLTTIINCIVNFLYHWFCWIIITNKIGLNKFIESVSFHSFGDDVVYSADPTTGFTFENISKIMIEYLEQDYTDAQKGTEGHTKKIEELSFLKRGFKVISHNVVYAPIVTESIESRYVWTQIDPTDYRTHYENIEEGLVEAAMHSSEYFKYFSNGIRRGISMSHFNKIALFSGLSYTTYQDYLDLVDERFRGTSCLSNVRY